MATLPTAKDTADKILRIFGDHKKRPGEGLLRGTINSKAACGNWTQDVEDGIQYGCEKGWFEYQNNFVRLTQDGYARI